MIPLYHTYQVKINGTGFGGNLWPDNEPGEDPTIFQDNDENVHLLFHGYEYASCQFTLKHTCEPRRFRGEFAYMQVTQCATMLLSHCSFNRYQWQGLWTGMHAYATKELDNWAVSRRIDGKGAFQTNVTWDDGERSTNALAKKPGQKLYNPLAICVRR